MIRTERLILRPWKESDIAPFAAMNGDPRVMEYFPSIKTEQESFEEYRRITQGFKETGWGFWAASLAGVEEFIGFIGLKNVTYTTPFTPAVEIGWRLAYDHWGKGYATEGAHAALEYGFSTLKLGEIVSFTTVKNMRSRNVMEKIGMQRDPKEDFDHPLVPASHPLKRHVLYRINYHQQRSN